MTGYINRVVSAKTLAAEFMALAVQVETDYKAEAELCDLPHKSGVHPYRGGRVNAAMRRKSMDLARALSALRKSI